MLTKEQQNKIDREIGGRLRARRKMIGKSQDQVAQACGITFQQMQKYEHGTNRISASRMVQLGEVLGVPPAYFFGDATAGKKFPEFGLSAQAVDIAKRYDAVKRPQTKEMIRKSVAAFTAGANA